MNMKSYNLNNFEEITQINKLSKEQINAIKVVGNVLPFKANSYVIDELIDWNNIPNDPIFQLVFPQKGMLSDKNYKKVENALNSNLPKDELRDLINKIRYKLNPHPAGQKKDNIPEVDGIKLTGVQHKYDQTVLFFPNHGQTCHAYCTFCFRWPQFVGIDELKFASRETDLLVKYVQQNKQITDVLFTGGDPMVMSAKRLEAYINPLIEADIPNLRTIRIGSKSLSYWPYKFVSDKDSEAILALFKKVVDKGIHLSFMAHFNHPIEMKTDAVKKAVKNILSTGAQIRTQSPIMRHINDSSEVWETMWKEQVRMGMIPYYMFLARDTSAQDYFAVTLERSLDIYNNAYKNISGVVRTVRGPSMSAAPGKVQVLGINEINGEKVFVLKFLQARNTNWLAQPFFAKYNKEAIWLDDLEPAFNEEKFVFEEDEFISKEDKVKLIEGEKIYN